MCFLFFAGSIVVSAQPGEPIQMHSKPKDGVEKTYYSNGIVREVKRFKNGKLHGKQELFFATGKYEAIYHYKDNLQHGKSVRYWENGQLKEEVHYTRGYIDGTRKRYTVSGELQSVESYLYRNDSLATSVLNGKYLINDELGRATVEGSYHEGLKDGTWKSYRDGRLTELTTFDKGVQWGPYEQYHSNGNLRARGILVIETKNDKPHGLDDGRKERWYENGNLEELSHFNKGIKHGEFARYYKSGQVQWRAYFSEGLQTGLEEYFSEDGLLISQKEYKIIEQEGKKTSIKTGVEKAWKNGALITEIHFDANGLEHGTRKSYYTDGTLSSEMEFVHGKMIGKYIDYHPNGKIKYERTMQSVLLPGGQTKETQTGWQKEYELNGMPTRFFFRDSLGEVSLEKSFYRGRLSKIQMNQALQIYFFPTGQLMSISVLDQSSRPVLTSSYYMNGSLRKITFQDLATRVLNHATFTDDGRLIDIYTDLYQNPDSAKASIGVVNQLKKIMMIDHKSLDIESLKDLPEVLFLRYANGVPMIEARFENGVPEGIFLAREPLSGDTLIFRSFKNGMPYGKHLEKFGGVELVRRGFKRYGNRKDDIEDFSPKGIPVRKQLMQADGTTLYMDYYPNGVLKSMNNYDKKLHASYFKNGQPHVVREEWSDTPGRTVYKEYYEDPHLLRQLSFYTGDVLDSTQYHFHPNGKLKNEIDYKDSKRNGRYLQYNESGELQVKGEYVDNLQDGMWVSNIDVVPDTTYFAQGKQYVREHLHRCECIDTLLAKSAIRFVPSVGGFFEPGELQAYFPRHLKPTEEFNPDFLFYYGFQGSGDDRGGYYSFTTLTYRELAFEFPATSLYRMVLNPCRTEGYIPQFPFSVQYYGGDVRAYTADLELKRIAMEFVKGPLVSLDSNYPHFTAVFGAKRLRIAGGETLQMELDQQQPVCITPGRLKGLLDIQLENGLPEFTENAFWISAAGSAQFTWKDDTGSYLLVTDRAQFVLNAARVEGELVFACTGGDEGQVVLQTGEGEITLSSDEIRRQWLLAGFTGLKIWYEDKHLNIRFFAE